MYYKRNVRMGEKMIHLKTPKIKFAVIVLILVNKNRNVGRIAFFFFFAIIFMLKIRNTK